MLLNEVETQNTNISDTAFYYFRIRERNFTINCNHHEDDINNNELKLAILNYSKYVLLIYIHIIDNIFVYIYFYLSYILVVLPLYFKKFRYAKK